MTKVSKELIDPLSSSELATDSVGAAQIAAGAVDTAELADNAVTLAKMAGGTAGNLITYDASADPALVAVGTSGQVLTSNGAGAAPTFQTVSGIPTGTVAPYVGSTEPTGWLFLDGDTIGSVASSADHAHADYQTLFELLWDSMADAEAPVLDNTGTPVARGGSASADWSADRRITLPDAMGRTIAGKDNMDGVGANRLTSGSAAGLDGDTLGKAGGVEEHAITAAQMPAHTHTVGIGVSNIGANPSYGSNGDTPTLNTGSAGSNNAHTNVQPTLVLNMIIKV